MEVWMEDVVFPEFLLGGIFQLPAVSFRGWKSANWIYITVIDPGGVRKKNIRKHFFCEMVDAFWSLDFFWVVVDKISGF